MDFRGMQALKALSAKLVTAAAILAALPVASLAAAVQIDGGMWHATVVRPVDLWVGDAGAREDSLAEVKDHEANYFIYVRGQLLRGGRLIFQGPSDDPVVTGVREELERNGFSLTLSQRYMFTVDDGQYMKASLYPGFAAFQARSFLDEVRAEGDPDELEGHIRGQKILGGLVGLATIGIADKLGGTTAAMGIGESTIPGDVEQLAGPVVRESIPFVLPKFDSSPYDTVSVRRIKFKGGMNGEIIIALKKGFTEDDERQALIKSVAVALGVGDSPEAIEAARAEDLAQRRAIWKDCDDVGGCNDGPATAAPRGMR